MNKTIASVAFGGSLLAAIAANAQVSVNTNPNVPGAPAAVQAGPVTVQAGPAGSSVTIAPGTISAAEQVRQNALVRQELREERRDERITERQAAKADWRMQFQNGTWWYWQPNNTWSYYQNNQWNAFNPNATAAGTAPVNNNSGYFARRGPLGLRRYSVGYRGQMTGGAPVTPPSAPPQAPNAPAPSDGNPPQNTGPNSTPPSRGPATFVPSTK